MTFRIELAQMEDAPAILALQKQAYVTEAELHNDHTIPPLHQSLESLREEFQKGIVLKALYNNQIVGSVRAFGQGSICCIGKLIVDASCQNLGLGQRLMQTIENYFPQASRFELFTGYKSAKNLYLYRKLGFEEVRRQTISTNLTLVFLQKCL